MNLTKLNLSLSSTYIIGFITFAGYYAVLAFALFIGFADQTRYFTIPMRLIIVGIIAFIILYRGYRPGAGKIAYIVFITFWSLYFLRIIIEVLEGNNIYHQSMEEYFLYAVGFGALPFIFFSENKKELDYERIFYSILISGAILGIACLFLYRNLIGMGIGRVSSHVSNLTGYAILSPLALSYCGALIMGLSSGTLLYNDTSIKKKIGFITLILLSLWPFLLGASRGSVIALVIPLIMISLLRGDLKTNIRISIFLLISIPLIIYLSEISGSSVLTRTLNITEAIESGSSSAVRLVIWNDTWNQFLTSPLFGNSLSVDNINYPHNLILEVLVSTGLLGIVPFMILIGLAFRKSLLICRTKPEYIWVVIIFWQAFIKGMFSGALYNSVWFWSSLGLILSVRSKELESNKS